MKKRNVFKLIYELLKLIGPFIFYIVLAVIMGTLGFILAMSITIVAALVVVKFLGSEVNLSYPLMFVIIISSGILRGILRYFEQYFNHYIAFRLLAILRGKIFNKLRELSPSKLEGKNKGEIISMLQSDIETLEVFYAHTITPTLIAILTSLTVFLFVGFVTNFTYAFVALFSYVVIGVIIPVLFYKSNKKYGKNYRKRLGDFNEFYLDSIYGGYEIISSNNQNNRINKVNAYSKELINIYEGLEKKNTLFKNITNTTIVCLNILIIFIGAMLINANIVNDYSIILAYVCLTSSFGSVVALASLPNNLSMTFASGNRVLDLLEEKPIIEEYDKVKEFDFKTLKLKDVSFSYDTKPIMKNINMEINKGEIVGILGPSGCGKSTLLKLLMHFYDVDEGCILYNENNIKDISYKKLYDNVNLFSQTTYLFTGTIRSNLLIAKPDASEKELIKACKDASIYEYICDLKDGLDSKISDLKDNLSSGEKQRLGLARVFLKKPKLLLLDEATSNIDAINEGIILNALTKNKQDMTIVMISHRKSTLSICDKLYELKDGVIC